jgi:flagellin
VAVNLGSNISSIRAQGKLTRVSKDLSTSFERLSSGQRINRASDDAAGLSIASSLKNDKRIFTQGIRNFNDGISLLNVADGAIDQLSTIVVRLKELGEQSANGTYGVKQREAMDAEAQALSKEYFRIKESTAFNGRYLFSPGSGDLRLQGGYGTDGGIQSNLGGGVGTGTFSTSSSFNNQKYVALGDINGDGILDLAATITNQIQLRLGIGDGTYRTAQTLSATNVLDVQLKDVNNDGILDLLNNDSTSNVSIRIGKGDGTFNSATSFSISGASTRFQLTDTNADGNLDLVTTSGSFVYTRNGTGTGSFAAATTINATGVVHDVQFGDLNGDKIIDMVANVEDSGYENTARVFLGRGSGSFSYSGSYQAGRGPVVMRLGDVNGDSKLDIVTNEYYIGTLNVILGNGNGTFSNVQKTSTSAPNNDLLELADFNGDGILDAVQASTSGDQLIGTRLGRGDGTFGNSTFYDDGYTADVYDLALGDVNGDGVWDIVAGDYNGATTRLGNTTSGVAPLLTFNLNSRADSLSALSQFDQALKKLSSQRGVIGGFQARLNVGINTLQASADNYSASAARILDTDVASESANLVRSQILQQAASAVLSQANHQPEIALRLLRQT